METSPFAAPPSAVEIAHYFVEHTDRRNSGYDGIDLWRDNNDYCYLWVECHVDHDINHYFLLDIRTKRNGTEIRTYLRVSFDIFAVQSIKYEWHDTSVAFGAPVALHAARFESGMKWFLKSILEDVSSPTG